jgi:hypothetical protein
MKRTALVASLLCCIASVAVAQSPLDRRISIHVRNVALRDALDRVAALADVRLSYSGDHLPLDRRVSVSKDTTPVSDVLVDLLKAFPVQPVAVGSDHIVLAPNSSFDVSSRAVTVLERVVVTGSAIGEHERSLSMALDVVAGRTIDRRHETTLSRLIDGGIPGVWMWEQTPSSMIARYGSIRGASSFKLSYPKVYIDGIEVANPLLFTQITPEIVERVEIIRGPQGAALYGSDAISGVINVVSRHDGTPADSTHAQVRSEMGWSSSAFGTTPTPVQEHALTFRGGDNLRSAGLSLSGNTTGNYIPNGYSRELRGVVDGRRIGHNSTLTVTGRAHGKRAGVPLNPLVPLADEIDADQLPQVLNMYSLGSTYQLARSELVTYSVTAGIDGYRLRNISLDHTPVPSSADSALRAASGAADRATLRASAVRIVGNSDRAAATLTLATEQSILSERTQPEVADPSSSGPESGDDASGFERSRMINSGITGQANLAFRNVIYLTGGLRAERIDPARTATMTELLPMFGASVVRDLGVVTAKLRASYGRGIRPPRAAGYGMREPRRTVRNDNLAPESQSGIEGGFDIFVGRAAGFHLTRFDQRASGLIQTVTRVDTVNSGNGNSGTRTRLFYQLQNVGEISNDGWEAKATFDVGRLNLGSTVSFVDSRVERLAVGYTGDLRPGDKMLAVPARTASVSASWLGKRWSSAWSLSRAADWVNYDRLAIAEQRAQSDSSDAALTGEMLRDFWITYPGTTRLRASFGFDMPRGITFTVTGDNLLNEQRGEPDTITIVPGRTMTLGVRARF